MSAQNMHYLTVHDEDDYYRPSSATLSVPDRHKHKARSVSPLPYGYDESMASTPDLRSVSEMSFDPSEPTSSTESSPSLHKKRHKSIENLCFGVRNRKKLHRKAQVTELSRGRCYTEPQMKHDKAGRQYPVPILRIPSDDEATSNGTSRGIGSLLKQTLKVTSASMGFRAVSMER